MAKKCVGASSGMVNSNLFKSWSHGLGWPQRVSNFYIRKYIEKIFWNIPPKNQTAKKAVTFEKAFSYSEDSSLLNHDLQG